MVQKLGLFCGMVLLMFAGVFTSCDKNEEIFDTPQVINPVNEVKEPQTSELRATTASPQYYSTPGVGGTVPNSSITIKGKITKPFYGGALSAKLIKQEGNKFTVRISKQNGGVFMGEGHAIVMVGSPGGSNAGVNIYSAGQRFVDVDFSATFEQGCVHFYPTTWDRKTKERYYAEPILVYTYPMYKEGRSYRHNELLGVANGVEVRANGTANITENGENQCTKFCINYYNTIYGKNYVHYHNATEWFADTRNFPDLVRYTNGGNIPPRPGDILCMSGGRKKRGHVAIIMEVGTTFIKIAQQNTGIKLGVEWEPIGGTLSRNGNFVTAPDGYNIQGWMRNSHN